MTAANANPVLANAQQRYEVHRSDLPLSCPLPSMGLWNSHLRVYLAIEPQGGESDCPYFGAPFVLVDCARPRRPAGQVLLRARRATAAGGGTARRRVGIERVWRCRPR